MTLKCSDTLIKKILTEKTNSLTQQSIKILVELKLIGNLSLERTPRCHYLDLTSTRNYIFMGNFRIVCGHHNILSYQYFKPRMSVLNYRKYPFAPIKP